MYSKELFEKYPYAFSHYAWTGEVFYDEGQYRVRVDQTKNIEGKGSLKSFNYFKCNSLQEAQEKADYVLKTEDYGAI